MNVCMVSHRFEKGDGQARVNYEIVKRLAGERNRVTLIASFVAPDLLALPNVAWRQAPVRGWPTQLVKNLIFSLISTIWLLLIRRSCELVMVNGFITWAKSDINAVHYVHSSWLKSPAHPYRNGRSLNGLYQLIFTYMNTVTEKIAFSRTRCLVPVSEKVRDELAELGFSGNVRVIQNGVDTEEFTPSAARDRRELGLPEDVPLALFAGDIKSSRKNLDSVLRAMVNIKDLHLAVAGSTKGSPYMELAERLELGDRVHFLGFRRDVAALMSSSDFFVFPSRYEACTLAVIEALSSGLPVITTYQSGVSELVEPADGRKAGMVLADPENVQELEEAMQLLTSKPDVRAAMGAAARFAAERLGWETVASNYIQLFEAGKKPKEKELRVMGFATQGSSGDDENRLRALLSQLPSEIIPFDRRNKFKNSWNIFRIMSREKPGMMVMEGTGIAGGMALLAGNLVAGVPYVVSSGDAVGPFVSSQYPLLGPIFSWYEKLLYKRASGFIGWTPYLAGRALTYGAKFGMTAAGWAPFPYGDDELRQSRLRIRERYGIPAHHIVIGIVGSLHWNKRVGYCYGYELVKSILRIKRTDITVMIVGEGSGKEHLEKLAEGKPNIVFTGRVPREEVPAYLAAMDLASLPQSVDRVGSFRYTTKVSEYALVGLPIVTGKIPMSYDLNTGWMFRLNGWTPWDELYISSLSSLLEGITWEDIRLKRDNVPRDSPEFDKENQVRSVKEFIWDIWYEVSIRK